METTKRQTRAARVVVWPCVRA